MHQTVPEIDLCIAGWEIKVSPSARQQVFTGLSMKKGKGCSVFFVRSTTPKIPKTNRRYTILLQACVLKKSALKDHSISQQHKDAIEAEMLSRVSQFHKEVNQKAKVKDAVTKCFSSGILAC